MEAEINVFKVKTKYKYNRWNCVDICLKRECKPLCLDFFVKFFNYQFFRRHIGLLNCCEYARSLPIHNPYIFWKSTSGFLLTPSGSEMAAKQSTLLRIWLTMITIYSWRVCSPKCHQNLSRSREIQAKTKLLNNW